MADEPVLGLPQERLRESFLEALVEYQAEGLYRNLDIARLRDPAAFRDEIDELRLAAAEEVARPAWQVPETTFWWVSGDHYLGRLSIRHRLTAELARVGGHIGFDVRPSARRRGHATGMLAAARPYARQLGIDPAVLTCDSDNKASQRVIEANAGELIDERDGVLRFRLQTT
jgi:predicted acetyltransferase